jgi:plastocyanin
MVSWLLYKTPHLKDLLVEIRDVYILLTLLRDQMIQKRILFGLVILAFTIAITIYNVSTSTKATTTGNDIVKIAAGGGNVTAPWTMFLPQNVTVNVGDTIEWYNPTMGAAEPHTITFMFDNSTFAGVVSPLGVSNTTEFTAIPPGSNSEALLIPGEDGTKTLIGINARTYSPVTIDLQDKVQFMNPNANYSIAGDEKYVNSGWILPEGLEKQFPGTGNTFMATFEKPGTYDYLCILHPWMVGTVNVVG